MSLPTRLSIIGAGGRLGQLVTEQALADPRFAVQDLIVSSTSIRIGQAAFHGSIHYRAEFSQAFDVLIDVSLPHVFAHTQAALKRFGGALVCGTTGFDQATLDELEAIAKTRALLHTHNFSHGIAVLQHLAECASKLLGPDYQVGIIDLHHQHKLDSPSGTALSLQASLQAGGATQVQHSALRIGAIVGEHQVHFAGTGERLCLTHSADSRLMFAKGALDAAAWIANQKPGRYSMRDVFGIAI
jgi:4-hydroxy-tetrahydrodipicolinate reductase